MKEIISKELYEEIQKDYINFESITQDEYITEYNEEDEEVEYINKYTLYAEDSINIYRLLHKCKEWCKKDLTINYRKDNEYRKGWVEVIVKYDETSVFANKPFKADTEPEAIFKACQWILENKDN